MKIKNIFAFLIVIMISFSYFSTAEQIKNEDYDSEIYTLCDKNDTPEFWGVLVGSNPQDDSVGEKAIKNVNKIKNILLDGGWKENHIKLLKGNVTKNNVFHALSWLEKNVRSVDTVLIFLRDHGLYGSFALHGGRLWYQVLDKKLSKINCAGMAVIISACHSGSAIKFLQKNKRVILTSCDEDEKGGFNPLTIEMGLKGFADIHEEFGNKNGFVSVEELYEYCIAEKISNPDYIIKPRIQDNYEGQLSLTFHNWTEECIDQMPRYASVSNYVCLVGRNDEYQAAQSFIPNNRNLTKVQLLIENVNLIKPYPITITIRKELKGDNLTSKTLTPVDLKNRTEKYLTFDFPDIQVNPGEKYYIVCNSTAPWIEPWSCYKWRATFQNSYDLGCCYRSYDNGKTWDIDEESDALFIIYSKEENINHVPYTPFRVAGNTFGKKNIDYSYCTSTKDFEEDQIYYKFYWGDDTVTDWLGPYESGEAVCASHNWSEKGTYYVKVQAKDEYTDRFTDWSDTLRVDISRSKIGIKLEDILMNFPFLNCLFDVFFNQ